MQDHGQQHPWDGPPDEFDGQVLVSLKVSAQPSLPRATLTEQADDLWTRVGVKL